MPLHRLFHLSELLCEWALYTRKHGRIADANEAEAMQAKVSRECRLVEAANEEAESAAKRQGLHVCADKARS